MTKIFRLYTFDAKEMRYKKNNKFIALFTFNFLILAFMVYWNISQTVKTNEKLTDIEYISEETKIMIINKHNEFSEEKLKEYLLDINVRFPHIVMAQAKLESNNFKSKIFRENHNMFGMKVATKRPTLNKGEEHNHAYYDSWRESVLDYAFYQSAYLFDLKTENDYYDYLAGSYAEDPNYIIKVRSIANKEKLSYGK